MNTLHIDEQRGWRGGEQQASYLMRGLAQRGHRVVAAGRPGTPFLETDHGIPGLVRIAAPFRSEFDPFTARTLARAIVEHEIDIVHAHTSHAHTAACFARRLAGRGAVIVSRRVDFAPRANAWSRWKYTLPDRIVAISDFIASVMREFGVDASRLRVVHSATDFARFDVEPLPRETIEIPEGVPLLGNVAALVGHKDHATLIDAMPHVLEALPSLHLVIAGEGELRPQIEARIARLGVQHAVHLLGYRKDIPRLLYALDAFVLSSKEEGLGTSVLDAMACGVPVAATAAGGIPEMVRHEETGLLSPPGDARALAANLVQLFQDRELAARLASRAREYIHERFAIDAMIEGNLRVYEECLSKSNR